MRTLNSVADALRCSVEAPPEQSLLGTLEAIEEHLGELLNPGAGASGAGGRSRESGRSRQRLRHRGALRLAERLRLPLFTPPPLQPLPIDPRVGRLLPPRWCRQRGVAPLLDDGRLLDVALSHPRALGYGRQVWLLTGRVPRWVVASTATLRRVRRWIYPLSGACSSDEIGSSTMLPWTR